MGDRICAWRLFAMVVILVFVSTITACENANKEPSSGEGQEEDNTEEVSGDKPVADVPAAFTIERTIPEQLILTTENCRLPDNSLTAQVSVYANNLHLSPSDPGAILVQTIPVEESSGGDFVYRVELDEVSQYSFWLHCESSVMLLNHKENSSQLLLNVFVSSNVDGVQPGELVLPVNHIETSMDCAGCHSVTDDLILSVMDYSDPLLDQCNACHDGAVAVGKSDSHVLTIMSCHQCHESQLWAIDELDHNLVTGMTCVSCHNNSIAQGKTATHIPSDQECDACHAVAPSPWAPVELPLDHSHVIGTCIDCHCSPISPVGNCGQGPSHPLITHTCDACHSTNTWLPLLVDHSLTSEDCITCHDGTNASGKTGSHIPATDNCNACHEPAPNTWAPVGPANVDHDEVIGTCESCHAICMTECNIPQSHNGFVDSCDACHEPPNWLPTQVNHTLTTDNCVVCHNGVDASGKSANHINTTDECESCHEPTFYWVPVRSVDVDHQEVIGTCASCHICVIGPCGIPFDHPHTVDDCGACHSPPNWLPLQVDHSLTTDACVVCHNNVDVMGKTSNHINSSDACQSCHKTTPLEWFSVDVDHNDTIGACVNCHDGCAGACPLPPHPINTTGDCAACHNADSWIPVDTVDHNAVLGNCSDCHNGVLATGKSTSHTATNQQCDTCHTTSGWAII